MSQEILARMAAAMATGDWATVAECAGQMGQATPPPKKAARKKPEPTPPPEESKPAAFANKFKDDKTLEKAHIASDRKLLKGFKPTARRPPSSNRPVEVFCPKCNKPHMVAAAIVALRRETDSGIVCPACLRSNRR